MMLVMMMLENVYAHEKREDEEEERA